MVLVVSIEASIAAGKSTIIEALFKRMEGDIKFILIPEPVEEWGNIMIGDKDILTTFYENMKETALPFQLIALLTRKTIFDQKMKEAELIEKETGQKVILVTERTVHSDRHIFAKMLHESGFINDAGFIAYEMWNEIFCRDIKIHKVLYINTPPNICHERVAIRARSGEEGITLDYLTQCQNAHDRFYDEVISKGDHMSIDTSNILVGTSEYEELVDSVIEYFKN